MKVQNPELHNVYNLNTGRSEGMTLDESGIAHIQSVLTNLYADPIMAVIREYTTNAWDSMVEAGRGDIPITIHAPTTLTPVFKVADTGMGMSVDDVFGLYKVYGKSTKRESNDFTGQLGIGSKSALAYANQFTITTVKDGTKAVFSIHFNESGVGTVTLLQTLATDSHNGVEVAIPVRVSDINKFSNKIATFLKYVQAPYDVSQDVVQRINHENIEMLFEGAYLDTTYNYRSERRAVIHMGNVTYPVDLDEIKGFPPVDGTVVIYVDIGDVQMTPNREALLYNKRTRETINKFIKNYEKWTIDTIEANAKTASKLERFLYAAGMPTVRYSSDLYNKMVVIYLLSFRDNSWAYTRMTEGRSKRKITNKGLHLTHNIRTFDKALVVTGGLKRGLVSRLDRYMDRNHFIRAYIIDDAVIPKEELDYILENNPLVVSADEIIAAGKRPDQFEGYLHGTRASFNTSTSNYTKKVLPEDLSNAVVFTRADLTDDLISNRLNGLRQELRDTDFWMVSQSVMEKIDVTPLEDKFNQCLKDMEGNEEYQRALAGEYAQSVIHKIPLLNSYSTGISDKLVEALDSPEINKLIKISEWRYSLRDIPSFVLGNYAKISAIPTYNTANLPDAFKNNKWYREVEELEAAIEEKYPLLYGKFSDIVVELLVEKMKQERTKNE